MPVFWYGRSYFGESVDFYLGVVTITVEPSVIIHPTSDDVEVLRQGSITL